jgi:hypothetical protein
MCCFAGKNAAESLEKVFLRYRLDGLDMNIGTWKQKTA